MLKSPKFTLVDVDDAVLFGVILVDEGIAELHDGSRGVLIDAWTRDVDPQQWLRSTAEVVVWNRENGYSLMLGIEN